MLKDAGFDEVIAEDRTEQVCMMQRYLCAFVYIFDFELVELIRHCFGRM